MESHLQYSEEQKKDLAAWSFKTPGIPDGAFERSDNVPITKEEVRVIQISKARLNPGQIIYDVGCGSGSISVEAAIQTESNGKVIAIDHDHNAIELTKKNLEKFSLTNVSVIFGDAKEKIPELEPADAVFVGGTGGDTQKIIELCHGKLKAGGRIVIGVILVETLYASLQSLERLAFDSVEVTQIAISKGRKTSTGTMLLARNPVAIISATKNAT